MLVNYSKYTDKRGITHEALFMLGRVHRITGPRNNLYPEAHTLLTLKTLSFLYMNIINFVYFVNFISVTTVIQNYYILLVVREKYTCIYKKRKRQLKIIIHYNLK